ncbi:Hsp33 family molecular chaperone HslO [Loigolactobacillus backii]|uniref:33 kDa chaperonin n=1 Tax=Loigolactobacillus backii TaxID=375175 RepID=A0A192GXT2_9LACO|nr:Hsp33 family molecular chaperone HslO [Loigolactobacillus backii]ANK59007.1 molecular chaperone Hsp33 [Loigolactobacillus backii]ANK61324.1 molecular chaperone Hsp33 [Loigolactobacillus backii]ANK63995.1 molecular chaperone Hsp33 [Loigolactobacillus backii]ANK66444.1 molecular chaperone Hsp33 [Loigolactobacillus backii]ANK69476.1 molecular chaperone Hsp33 [Loigolactobacillus backii]
MADYLIKSLAYNDTVRAYAVDASQLVAEAQRRHGTWSASSAALGRTLIATLLMSSAGLQGSEKMTVKVMGDGPVGAIVADGNTSGTVKGYAQNPHVHLPLNKKHHIDVAGAVGKNGTIAVTKDMGLGKPFTGQTPIVSGELGDDFTYYMAASEQIPSSIGVSVFVKPDNSIDVAGGFLIEMMPGATDATAQELEQKIKALPLVSDMLRAGKTPAAILTDIFGAELKIIEKMPVAYKCDCSKARFGKSIASLNPEEIQAMIDEDGGAEAVCQFCGNKYEFSVAELKTLKMAAEVKKNN